MISTVNKTQLVAIIKRDHPQWTDEAISTFAEEHINNLDAMFDEPLSKYVINGEMENCSYGEFSIKLIQAFVFCSYFDAIVILDEYIKDPIKGKAKLIL